MFLKIGLLIKTVTVGKRLFKLTIVSEGRFARLKPKDY